MLYLPFLWLLVVHKSARKMMDLQMELEGWLEESTLFPIQQTCYTTDLCPENKNEPAVSSIGDGWLDEKLDLSIFDFQDNWLEPQDDSGKMIADDASISLILDSLMGISPVATGTCPVEENERLEISCDLDIPLEVLVQESIPSPQESEHNSYAEDPDLTPSEDLSSPVGSPTSSVASTSSENLVYWNDEKAGFFKYTALLDETFNVASPPSEAVTQPDQSSVGPVFSATKFRKTPYESRKEARRERKKVQNKEAAARYRTKRRIQDKELNDEVEKLEAAQKVLQAKYDQLKGEVSYLKSLMKEMLQRRGLLK